ncbi:YiiX/YebB-like N1pC/P60 family cysteine hydrolase [Dyadobacter bucti]|uniref:YiiX/YebB-like N1pC/P60 family cysteine hydrolase n=1 Tax=Dyadobacter bucti TaxID=2572203 RepID=UPI001109517A|nr:YiiX/YebB-like N1pC/P60 family cysteine hydrolase [Dyadobacter bucti]
MKKNISIICLIICTIAFAAAGQNDIPLSPSSGGSSVQTLALQNGDILFSTTNSLVSNIVRVGTSGPISHVAIVTDMLTQNSAAPLIFVVESVSPKVRKLLFEDYSKDATVIVAFRHPNATNAQRASIVAWLNKQAEMGVSYNLWAALLAAPKFNYLQKLHLVDFGKTKGTFCSKLVIDAYKEVGIDLGRLSPGQNWDPNSLATLQWFDDLNYVGHIKYTP